MAGAMYRILLLFVAVAIPPLAVWLTGRPVNTFVNGLVYLAALVVFFFFYAGPGFLIYCLGILHALLCVLISSGRSASADAST